MTPSAIIFDLDGTLAESKTPITPEMGTALKRLIQKMPVAVMSGGSYAQFQKQFFSGMPSDMDYKNLYLFPTSGAQCYEWKDGRWHILYSNPLAPDEKSQILQALKESLDEIHFDQPAQRWGEQIEDRDSQISWSALGQNAPYAIKKTWDPDRSKRIPIQQALLKRLVGFSIRVNATSTIDITHEGITKAYGIRKFSELIHVPVADMLYVGDALFPGGNDEVVKQTSIATRQVTGPEETLEVIKGLLQHI